MPAMSGYTKLFNSILASTVWREPMETRIVWITLLAMADKDGVAEASVPGLADFARVSVEATREALDRLSSPDPDSRSKEHNGRRIEAVEGGWQLLNHAKYRAKMGADERREYNRIKQAQYRARQQKSITVNHGEQNVHIAEADTEAKALKSNTRPSLEEVSAYCLERKNSVDPQKWFDHYEANGWKVGRNSMKSWKAAVRTWEKSENGNGKPKQPEGKCAKHPVSGLTEWGTCWGCYAESARHSR